MEETETVEVEEDIEVVEDDQDTVNPLVYVVATLVATGVAYAGFRFWQNRRRNNRLAVVEALDTHDEENE